MALGAHAAGDLESLADGADIGLTLPGHIGLMVVGVLLGILVGALPGLDAPHGVALLLPLTFIHVLGGVVRRLDHLDPVQHSRRALFGGHYLRRLPHGPSGSGGRGPGRMAAAFSSALIGALRGVLLTFLSTEIEGVIAPETADHAAGTSALLPMLTLGIPDSASAAKMLGGLMIWGLPPGPTLFFEQHDFAWGLIATWAT